MEAVDRDEENEAERAEDEDEDEEVDFDSDTPFNTPPESLSGSHRRLTYASWHSSDESLDDESRFWRHR